MPDVEIVDCTNTLTIVFRTLPELSQTDHCLFFSAENWVYSGKDRIRAGIVASEVVRKVLEYREVRQVYVHRHELTVVLKAKKEWGGLEQVIAYTIEKIFEEFGLCNG